MATSLPLQIQSLGSAVAQTLVMAHVSELRSSVGAVSPRNIEDMFLTLRVPVPSNVSQYLAILSKRGLIIKLAPGRWALTPKGKNEILQLMSGVPSEAFKTIVSASGEALLGDTPHHLLPPELAPAKFQSGIARFLEGHPFERNVFCMSRFARDEDDPVGPAIDTCRSTCGNSGLELHLATDRAVEELLFGNIAAAMWACNYAVAIFENRRAEGVKPNVALEVGAMLMTGRRCLLLKDSTVEHLPTDLVGHLYQPVDITDSRDLATTVKRWITQDLGLAD